MLTTLRNVWRSLPLPHAVRATISPLYGVALGRIVRRFHSAPLPPDQIGPGGVVASGFFSDVTGIGRAGRLTLDKVREWGIPVIAHDLRRDPAGRTVGAAGPGGLWICHCNAPQVFESLLQGTDRLWATRYRIGYWAYELEDLPRGWHSAIRYFHEIWAPSAFVASAIERARGDGHTHVRVVPHPLPDCSGATRDPSLLGPAGQFTFLATLDARSSFARKNPIGTLRAFQMAFSPEDRRVGLVIKIVSATTDPQSRNQLEAAAQGWPNVRITTEELSDVEAMQLIASADCLVTLHRSEGFGLTIAEAMAVGTPVIATNWSGNVEFAADAVMAIPYQLVPTEDSSGRYAQSGARWAEPDIAAASQAMRQVFEDEPMRAAMVERAKRLVVDRLGGPISSAPYERFIAREVRLAPPVEPAVGRAPQPE